MGEVLAAIPLMEEIRRRTPRIPIFLSVTTLAGRAVAERRLEDIGVFYAPMDFVWVVRRVLRRIRPSLLIVMETEIWPNLFREAHRIGCGLVIANGRISDGARSKYRRFAGIFGPVLALCDRIVVQSDAMLERFVEAGAPVALVETGGNLKYDIQPARVEYCPEDSRPLWIAASTCADAEVEEEDFVIEAQRQLPGWRLMIAPRKPERFEVVAAKLSHSGLKWRRRTDANYQKADVLLLDTIGELSGLFEHADVVFMGGTIAAKGGHNILEPALFGKPVIAGPHLENFRDIAEHFESEQAILRIESGEHLADAVLRAAGDAGLGARSLAAARTHSGAACRTAETVMRVYATKYPCDRPAQPKWMVLWFLAQIWKFASASDRKRKKARARKLPVPVVSIGNITAGGTGKTPVTIELLCEFASSQPGLLTRGHGRSSSGTVIFGMDSHAGVDVTGDEAQLYRRALAVPVGIGAERYDAGIELLKANAAKLLFLDDGFQHLQLHRDFDLVLIDALSPFGGGHLLPLGRLREPLAGLSRAHAFLITRADEVPDTHGIEFVLRSYNAAAPIFHARTLAGGWTNEAGRSPEPGVPAIAFCGLGNPQAFWNTLDKLDVNTRARLDYGDHHRYSPIEIRRLTQHARDLGVETLLTTAKDAVNLCPDVRSMIDPMQMYWLEISVEIDRREELVSLIAGKI